MVTTVCEIPTASASRLLQQLCRHFAHKIPAECTPTEGSITFPLGPVALAADGERLSITLSAETAETLAELEDVVIRHLVRFAFRETLVVTRHDAA